MNKPSLKTSLFLAVAAFSLPSTSALTVNSGASAADLVNQIAGSGITVVGGSISYIGAGAASGTFTGGLASGIGINNGILLTTGLAEIAVGPNNLAEAGENNEQPGDAVLSGIAGADTFDAVVLQFDFTFNDNSAPGNLFFNYAFASEEYNEYVNEGFNDVFGFFLNGNNIALIPGSGDPVSIDNVNNGSNSIFFVDNEGGGADVQYDGFTTVLTAVALGLDPNAVHTIRLAIADAGDPVLDSGVFIQANTFSSTPTDPDNVPEGGSVALLGIGFLAAAQRLFRRK